MESPKDLRPISLTSFVLKTVERLVERYIRDKIVTAKPERIDQHAYRASRSIETALRTVVNLIEDFLRVIICYFLISILLIIAVCNSFK